jgi:hypothetical protein
VCETGRAREWYLACGAVTDLMQWRNGSKGCGAGLPEGEGEASAACCLWRALLVCCWHGCRQPPPPQTVCGLLAPSHTAPGTAAMQEIWLADAVTQQQLFCCVPGPPGPAPSSQTQPDDVLRCPEVEAGCCTTALQARCLTSFSKQSRRYSWSGSDRWQNASSRLGRSHTSAGGQQQGRQHRHTAEAAGWLARLCHSPSW